MKKKGCLTLVWMLIMVQLLMAFAAVSATAATVSNQEKHYTVYQAEEAIAIDGVADDASWELVPWADISILAMHQTKGPQDGFDAKFKAVYHLSDTAATVSFLIQVKDSTTAAGSWAKDGVNLSFQTGTVFNIGMLYPSDYTSGSWGEGQEYAIVDQRDTTVEGNDGSYTIEVCVPMERGTTEFLFDIWVQDIYDTWNTRSRYSWNGNFDNAAAQAPLGVCRLSPIPVSDLIGIQTTAGASIRLDPENRTTSGIRFATAIDMEQYNALKAREDVSGITTGTLVLPTEKLAGLSSNADAIDVPIPIAFTEADLNAAGMEAGKDYYNIVNAGNEWVPGAEGTWYGTLYHIKDFSRQFSGVGYITVEFTDGSSYTLYGGYSASNSRSIADVAQLALDNGLYTETANPDEWALLQEFIRGGAAS